MVLLPEWFFLRQRFLSVALLPERSFLQLRSALVLVFVPEQAFDLGAAESITIGDTKYTFPAMEGSDT